MINASRFPKLLTLMLTAVTACLPLSAQESLYRDSEPAWLSLERGKRAFAEKDFGTAIVEFDRAIATRRESFTAAAGRLDQALQSKAVKNGRSSIQESLAIFASEDFIQRDLDRIAAKYGSSTKSMLQALRKDRISDSHRAFIEVLLLVLEYKPIEELGDSIQRLRLEVDRLARYPEAEYWKGRVFFVEGELSIAEAQYMRAFDMSASLEIPDERFTILYSMAELHGAKNDFVAWENVLKSIVSGNGDKTGSSAGDWAIDPYIREAMMKTLVDFGFDRFMTLYRIAPSYTLPANAALAGFYLERGRAASSMHAAIAVNMTMTRAIAMMQARDEDYSWQGLPDFMERAMSRKDVASYLADSNAFGLMLVFADSLYIQGGRVAAAELWRAVAGSGTMPYAATAGVRLSNPSSAVRRAAP